MVNKKEKYQTITLSLSNGKQGTFMGPALITKAEMDSGVEINMPLKFTEPEELPEGVSFGKLYDEKENKN
jgi:hypothetical protein